MYKFGEYLIWKGRLYKNYKEVLITSDLKFLISDFVEVEESEFAKILLLL